MRPALIAYSTTDGHTQLICQRLQQTLHSRGQQAVVAPVAQAQSLDLAAFGVLVLGASIRYGHHQREVRRFISQHHAALNRQPNVFFSVNAVARKPEKRSLHTNPYVQRFLHGLAWQPQHVAIFAGKIDYPRYGFLDRHMIRFIMRLTGGPTDLRCTTEFTDWAQVEALGQLIADKAVDSVDDGSTDDSTDDDGAADNGAE